MDRSGDQVIAPPKSRNAPELPMSFFVGCKQGSQAEAVTISNRGRTVQSQGHLDPLSFFMLLPLVSVPKAKLTL